MAQKFGSTGAPPQTVMQAVTSPVPPYIPLADVAFGAPNIVLPHQLPPSSMVFPNAPANKMSNLPGLQTIYDYQRKGIAGY